MALTNVELDGNVAEGVTFANNGRQTLQAALAAGALDLTPYISTFRLLASGALATGTGNCSIWIRSPPPTSTCACRRRG